MWSVWRVVVWSSSSKWPPRSMTKTTMMKQQCRSDVNNYSNDGDGGDSNGDGDGDGDNNGNSNCNGNSNGDDATTSTNGDNVDDNNSGISRTAIG
jgi:hypothetical protein